MESYPGRWYNNPDEFQVWYLHLTSVYRHIFLGCGVMGKLTHFFCDYLLKKGKYILEQNTDTQLLAEWGDKENVFIAFACTLYFGVRNINGHWNIGVTI